MLEPSIARLALVELGSVTTTIPVTFAGATVIASAPPPPAMSAAGELTGSKMILSASGPPVTLMVEPLASVPRSWMLAPLLPPGSPSSHWIVRVVVALRVEVPSK